jgi:hypothetical protein
MPKIVDGKEYMTAKEIATILNIMSQNGKPHVKAIDALLNHIYGDKINKIKIFVEFSNERMAVYKIRMYESEEAIRAINIHWNNIIKSKVCEVYVVGRKKLLMKL